MNKNLGLLLLVAVLGFGGVWYMRGMQADQMADKVMVSPQPAYVQPIPPVDPVVESEEEAMMVEEKITPSESTDVADIEADIDISDIEKDLDGLDELELEIDAL